MKRFLKSILLVVGTLTFANMAAAETIKVGSTASGVPMTFLNVQTNKIEGVMVDVIQAVGREAKFDTEIIATDWRSLIPSLDASKIDLIAASMIMTPERAKAVLFSDPVITYGELLIVSAKNTNSYPDMTSLKNLKVGSQVGAVWIENLRKAGVTDIRSYDTPADMIRDLSLGRIDAVIIDGPLGAYILKNNPQYGLRSEKDYKPEVKAEIAIAGRHSDTRLIERVNAGLKAIKRNGELDKILAKWGVSE